MAPPKQQPRTPDRSHAGNSSRRIDHQRLTAGEAAVEAFKDYARERPEIVTMWAFGLGFVLGWKLRIW
ncbi:MAG TPA: hypothetical protein PJ982_04615 [Lacipirellulaceae bacterium]|nr:hypothetical protein [Lacipirellulaceae bacterium]